MNRFTLNLSHGLSLFQRVSSVLSIIFIMVLAVVVGIIVLHSSESVANDYGGLMEERAQKIEGMK